MTLVVNGGWHHNRRIMRYFFNYRPSVVKFLKLTAVMGLFMTHSANGSSQVVNPLMTCLGQEELKIHRTKTTGPIYFLNQLFINELATIYGVTLKESVLNDVCQKSLFSPSVNLLRILLLDGRKAFDIPPTAQLGGVEALASSSLESFLDEIPHVFFSYLSKLQALAPSAPCLEKEVPEISYFIGRYKYLEDAVGPKKLIEEKDKINLIFKKLIKFDAIIKKCQKESDDAEKKMGELK